MRIPVSGIDKNHAKAIETGFAPWNILRKFKHRDGGIVKLVRVAYRFAGDVYVTFSVADHDFDKDITHHIDDYKMVDEESTQ